jgi:hypothetical protein
MPEQTLGIWVLPLSISRIRNPAAPIILRHVLSWRGTEVTEEIVAIIRQTHVLVLIVVERVSNIEWRCVRMQQLGGVENILTVSIYAGEIEMLNNKE